MNREAWLAQQVLSMRTPLARAELAASRLLREGATPLARRLAQGIRDAVAELDGQIARTLRALAPREGGELQEDCRSIASELLERLAPVIEARGVHCASQDRCPGPVVGDPALLRRAGRALLRGGARLAGRDGSIRLGVQPGPDGGCVLQLEVSPTVPADPALALSVLAEARELAVAEEGHLAVAPGRTDHAVVARLELPHREAHP